MKIASLSLIPTLLLSGCAYNSTMGENDRFQVSSTASLFAPSVTAVLDTKTDSASVYAGPSIVGQTAQAAGTVAGGYLLGQGIGKSGTKVTQNGGGASQTQTGGNQSQGQLQGQAQGQFQGVVNNNHKSGGEHYGD